jgi:hypothetical protein
MSREFYQSIDLNGNQIIGGGVIEGSYFKGEEFFTVAVSDESTALTTGTAKVTFRAPFSLQWTKIPRASLNTASSSGVVTVDINEGGVSILSTKLTIDQSERTSVTAATPAVLSDTLCSDDDEFTIDIDTAGTGAKGLKVTFYYKRLS